MIQRTKHSTLPVQALEMLHDCIASAVAVEKTCYLLGVTVAEASRPRIPGVELRGEIAALVAALWTDLEKQRLERASDQNTFQSTKKRPRHS